MMVYEFDAELLNEKVQLFPDEIENDPWVVFHGTSSIFESEIDDHGFQWKPSIVTKKEVSHVVDIFTKMNWSGKDGGGLPILKPFSLESDFALGNTKPIYFASTSYRALLYSTHEFSCGETARALRKSIQDLEDYLKDKNIRDADMEYKMMEYNKLVSLNAKVGMRPIEVDLNWLEAELKKLSELKNRCINAYKQSSHGVVYAVKFTQEDICDNNNFDNHPSRGLRVFSKVPKEKIVGKISISSTLEYPSLYDKKRITVSQENGIIGNLNNRKKQG